MGRCECSTFIAIAFFAGCAVGVIDHKGGWEQFWEQFWFETWHITPEQKEAKRRRESRETLDEQWRKNGYYAGLESGIGFAIGALMLCLVLNKIYKIKEIKGGSEK